MENLSAPVLRIWRRNPIFDYIRMHKNDRWKRSICGPRVEMHTFRTFDFAPRNIMADWSTAFCMQTHIRCDYIRKLDISYLGKSIFSFRRSHQYPSDWMANTESNTFHSYRPGSFIYHWIHRRWHVCRRFIVYLCWDLCLCEYRGRRVFLLRYNDCKVRYLFVCMPKWNQCAIVGSTAR